MMLRSMSTFDPAKPAIVHDRLNDRQFEWKPDLFAENYREYAVYDRDGTVGWDGLILDGWLPLES